MWASPMCPALPTEVPGPCQVSVRAIPPFLRVTPPPPKKWGVHKVGSLECWVKNRGALFYISGRRRENAAEGGGRAAGGGVAAAGGSEL